MNYSPKKTQFFLLASILIVGVVFLSLYSIFSKQNNSIEKQPLTTSDNYASRRVFVKDLDKTPEIIDNETRIHLERNLYTNVVDVSKNNPGLYTGYVKPNSYSTVTSGDYTITELLVAIEPALLTYKINITKDSRRGTRSIYISCAPQNEQISQGVDCRQGAA